VLSLHFCFWAVRIGVHDIRFHRVSRKDVYLAIVTLTPWISFEALAVGVFNLTFYLLLFVFSRGQIGFGDVRLSLLIGLYLGVQKIGFSETLLVNFISWCLASVVVLGGRLCKWSSDSVPFAPFMFLSVVAATLIDTAGRI
jgi:prepilin signal peptidase PulO-like enzyme (type II secretory pathway)